MESKRKDVHQRAQMHRGIHNLILASLFLLAMLAALILHFCGEKREFSEAENRRLAQRPDFSWSALTDGSYFSGLDSFVSDQFTGRDRWIALKLKMERWLGRRESNGVYLCEEDYLIEVPEQPKNLAVWRSIDAVNAFAARHPELNFDMLIAPNAITVLEDLLPEDAPVDQQRSTLAMIANSLLSTVDFLDVTDTLCEHASEGMYYRTDHHWTSLAARYAFEAVSERLGIRYPALEYDVYTVSDTFEGTLASKSGSHSSRDQIDVYVPKDQNVSFYVYYPDTQTKSCSLYVSEKLEEKDHYTVFFGGNYPLLEIHTTCNNDRNLLLFKDSYANCFVQFLTPYFENIYLIDPRYYYGDVETVLQADGITDVLFLYNLNTFLEDTSLADALASEAAEE